MRDMEPLPKTIALSEKVYRTLLCLYPPAHRRIYGEQMRQLFRDQCRDAWRTGRSLGLMKVWLRVLPDLGKTSAVERIAAMERNQIMKSMNTKNGPTVLLIAGLVLCFLSFSPLIMSHDLFMPVMAAASLAILAKALVELFRPADEWLKIGVRTFVLMFLYALFMPAWAKLKMAGVIQNSFDPLDLFGIFLVSCLMINPVVAAIKLVQFLVQRRRG